MWAILLISFLFQSFILAKDGPIVETKYGSLQGLEVAAKDGSMANVFLGIRYANAPDNIYRFEKPHIVDNWAPILHHATRFRASCIPVHDAHVRNDIDFSEDCLFLNIMTPAERSGSLPVLVFIHGGGYEVGNAHEYGYQRLVDHFVTKGIVVVTLQYRLGPLGFFSLGDQNVPGNMGLWDMATALEFLQDVLPVFGGDNERITVSGHSAGSAAASALTFSPHADVYFHQTIEFSGSMFAEFALSDLVVEESYELAKVVGCRKNDHRETAKILECMKERTIQEILDGVEKIGAAREHPNFLKFHPRIDGEFFPYPLEQMLKSAQPKPVLSGFTDTESGIFVEGFEGFPAFNGVAIPKEKRADYSEKDLHEFIAQKVATEPEYGRKMGPFVELLDEYYIRRMAPSSPNNRFYMHRYTELLSDLQFVVPALHDLELRRLNNWPSWLYVITYQSSLERRLNRTIDGAWHATELKYLFDFMGIKEDFFSAEDLEFQKNFVDSLAAFIKNGDPSTPAFKWNPVSKDQPWTYAEFGSTPKMVKEYNQDTIDFWLNRVPKAIGAQNLQRNRLPGAHAHHVHSNVHTEL
ncbi:unnamed protein product, partial [Mesorhabditis belari]|uniref:Carboxylic ester hydrolase n=1 Tax=Mesorhabditis belari TaxID=2138241 RepID=A0AAF3ENQ6_9BILA